MSMTAIIGGTGFTDLDGLNIQREEILETCWGAVSAPVLIGDFHGHEVVFLARHAPDHSLPPHKINYRANIQALKTLGVNRIIAVNAVGGITESMDSGVICIPDQIIDYTSNREHTFFSDDFEVTNHIDFTMPYDEMLRQSLIQGAIKAKLDAKQGGVYGCVNGPRLETAAEILRMERDGCDLTGMTGMPEAALAREFGLPYASICLVVNRAAGKAIGEITIDAMRQVLVEGMQKVRQLIAASLI
ncbi:MAG: 5'-methylthioadenosine phosphorylase [Oceanospirillales bacterium LUC14_002_19_P2]|nr:MAG: 5'-methylthioadenosine phosphorylase [Oceanospirillales bacterium LUC14_002_19_P2]